MSNALMEKILKNSPTKYTAKLSESDIFLGAEIVPTDYPILNLAFSGDLDGGLVSGVTLVAGPTATYKSLLSLVCAKAYMDKFPDAVCIVLKFDIVKQLKDINRGEHVFFIIDSIGNTASLKELEDAEKGESKAEMQRAKVVKGLLRMITPSLVHKNLPCIAICHTYETLEIYSKTVISGGTGLMYSCNQAFIMGKQQEMDDKELMGYNFILKVEKSRFVRQKSKFPLQVLFDEGIQKYSGMKELAVEFGYLHTGAWCQIWDFESGKMSEKKLRSADIPLDFYEKLVQNPEFKAKVSEKYKLQEYRLWVDIFRMIMKSIYKIIMVFVVVMTQR